MYTSSEISPSFYGLPKIHKDGAPLRPIVISCGTPIPNLSKYLIPILKPLAGKMDSFVRNSADFTQKLSEIMLGPSETLTSYDVKSLFMCIPPQGALAAVTKRLERDDGLNSYTKLSVDNICDLLELCLTCTYFVYRDAFYMQKHGGAIGSLVSQILADLEGFRSFRYYFIGEWRCWPPAHENVLISPSISLWI